MDLNGRKRRILNQIVKRYITSGEPVASRQVARSPGIDLSPATVRNVMADLEAEGYLERFHKSAGSTPTDRGFRVYVDSLVPGTALPSSTRRTVVERMQDRRRELADDLGWVARIIADVTHEAGVAVRPLGDRGELEVVSLLPIAERRVLGVVVVTDGTVEKRVLMPTEETSPEELVRIANTLNHLFHGRCMDWIRNHPLVEHGSGPGADRRLAAEYGIEAEVCAWARDLFSSNVAGSEVLVEGAEQLMMSPDFSEVDRLRSLMVVLQDRDTIVREWRRLFVGDETRIVIGHESELTANGSLGMVATLFRREGRRLGAVGVVGPRRMDYLKVVPAVELVGQTLTQMFDEAI